ncbi:hypothetical protein BX070DRAFT_185834, partial [Coemansia spiralis]
SGVYSAAYSGVQVYEMICRGIAVMRRHSDSWLNATQLLKVAGVEKGRRTKILEREVLTGVHEKIQGGYGKYQGTWVPFARGVQLCKQYGVYEYVRPILEHDPTAAGTRPDKTPTKAERELIAGSDSATKRYKVSSSVATSPLNSDITGIFHPSGLGQGVPSTPAYPHAAELGSVPRTSSLANPLRSAIFLNDDPNFIPEWLAQVDVAVPCSPLPNGEPPSSSQLSKVNVDLVIDDQGHTAVHWAAALARIQVLDLLLYHGADARLLNYEGESALVRAVQVTNNYENQTFPDLLELLHDTIPLTDKYNRTVLHHIALAAGTEGRDKAARYYADCLLSWIPSADSDNVPNADFAAFLNLQDDQGNTALNIAARIGDRAIIRMLLNAGASPTLPNRVGLCPLDFGVDKIAYVNGSDAGLNSQEVWSPASAELRMHQSVLSIQRLMAELETDFAGEMRIKHEHFDEIKQQLRNTTIELAKARETIHQLQAKTTQLTETRLRVGYLEDTLARETSAVREAINALPSDSKPRRDLEALLKSLLTSPNGDDPFKSVDGELNLPLLAKDPAKILAAVERLRTVNQVYARRDMLLRERVAALRRRADVSERERQYRQIIASCCEIPEADVDIWIDRLACAVES